MVALVTIVKYGTGAHNLKYPIEIHIWKLGYGWWQPLRIRRWNSRTLKWDLR